MSSINSAPQAGLIIKAFAIIQLLSSKRTMSLKDMALQTNMSTPMAYKCIQTLCDLGYAYQNQQTQQYGLTLKLASVCTNMLSHYNITELALPVMQQLSDDTEETIHLAVRDDTECIYIHKIDSSHPLRLYSRVGKAAPLYCTGIGKILLAYENPKNIDSIINNINYIKHTENTITSANVLKEHLNLIKKQGFAEDIEEHEHHIRCLAYPIFDYDNNVVVGISLSMPSARWNTKVDKKHHILLSKSSKEISHIMGK